METVVDDIADKEREKLKQDSAKEVDNGNQGQDNVNETENKNPGEEVREVASLVEHHDSPSAVLDPEKGLVDPTMGSLVEQTDVISQGSLAISKNGVDSAKDGGDTPAVHDRTTSEPDSRPTEDDVKEPIEPEAEILMEVEKASEEPDSKISGDHNSVPVMPDNETAKENGTVNSAGHVRGLTDHHQETTMDCDKGPEVPVSESVLSQGNELSMPDMETSINPGKRTDLPVPDTLKDIDKKIDVLAAETPKDHEQGLSAMPATETSSEHDKGIIAQEAEPRKDIKDEFLDTEVVVDASIDSIIYNDVSVDPATEAGKKDNPGSHGEDGDIEDASMKHDASVSTIPCDVSSAVKSEEGGEGDLNNGVHKINSAPPTCDGTMNSKNSFLLDDMSEGNESGTEEEQSAFTKELEISFRARNMEFKPPKFYGEGLNCLKLWRAVIRLGGYDKVTGCKLWRQVGESFRPPKTCTTVSWTFRGFYEKALLEYERHKVNGGELQIPLVSISEPMNIDNQASGSGRARRDAAARAMQGWHSQRLLGNGEDKSSVPQQKRDKQIGTPGLLKRKRPVSADHGAKSAHIQVSKPLLDVTVVDVGPPAEWVKINVQRTKDCFEVYALVPGLLREEVRVQSDPAGRLVISGEPENPDNLWGATPFKKVVSLPARIDPHHTSAVVTLNGQLFVRVPLEQSD